MIASIKLNRTAETVTVTEKATTLDNEKFYTEIRTKFLQCEPEIYRIAPVDEEGISELLITKVNISKNAHEQIGAQFSCTAHYDKKRPFNFTTPLMYINTNEESEKLPESLSKIVKELLPHVQKTVSSVNKQVVLQFDIPTDESNGQAEEEQPKQKVAA